MAYQYCRENNRVFNESKIQHSIFETKTLDWSRMIVFPGTYILRALRMMVNLPPPADVEMHTKTKTYCQSHFSAYLKSSLMLVAPTWTRNNHHGQIARNGLNFNALHAEHKQIEDKILRGELRRWFGNKALYKINKFLNYVKDRDQN